MMSHNEGVIISSGSHSDSEHYCSVMFKQPNGTYTIEFLEGSKPYYCGSAVSKIGQIRPDGAIVYGHEVNESKLHEKLDNLKEAYTTSTQGKRAYLKDQNYSTFKAANGEVVDFSPLTQWYNSMTILQAMEIATANATPTDPKTGFWELTEGQKKTSLGFSNASFDMECHMKDRIMGYDLCDAMSMNIHGNIKEEDFLIAMLDRTPEGGTTKQAIELMGKKMREFMADGANTKMIDISIDMMKQNYPDAYPEQNQEVEQEQEIVQYEEANQETPGANEAYEMDPSQPTARGGLAHRVKERIYSGASRVKRAITRSR